MGHQILKCAGMGLDAITRRAIMRTPKVGILSSCREVEDAEGEDDRVEVAVADTMLLEGEAERYGEEEEGVHAQLDAQEAEGARTIRIS
mmetsp:Transcript_9733/g.13586  ORF Transcript_9733/g.13586 Transcript_9733/m.13586 type:complete len:89 (+) Transcript_9733:239-505(+)